MNEQLLEVDCLGIMSHRGGLAKLLVSASASHTVSYEYAPGRVITKTIMKMVQTASLHAWHAMH